MNLAHWLHRVAQVAPDRMATFNGFEPVESYGQLSARVMALAGGLAGRGVKAGDRVALFLKNTPDYLTIMQAVWTLGAAVVPINAKLHPKEVAWIVENAEASLVFTFGDDAFAVPTVSVPSAEYAALCASEPIGDIAPRGTDDLAWLFYTSGTTGRPKGVEITHGMLQSMALTFLADVDEVSAQDAALYAAPFSHGAGLYSLMHVLKGARHVFPASGGFDEPEIFALARHHDRIHMFAAPTMVKRMTDHARATGADGQGLRTIVYAGGPMYTTDILEAVETFGPVFVQIYGQGECPMAITALSRHDVTDRSHPRWRERLASVGRAQSVVEVCVSGADGVPLPVGQVGEILVRGQVVMPRYWRNPQASADTLRDGWLWTGDMGRLDADGYLTLQDRSKDVIISGGTNIYPREVEEVLLTHPQVSEVAVVGRPHPEWGEDVVAFVVPVAGPRPDYATLDAFCLAEIARFKRPKAYVFVDALPKNNYGKVVKTELRAQLGDHTS